MSEHRIVPVILSGGSGTRLWPVSRESFPKQLWPLVSDRTLLQETALRARGDGFAPPMVVCNQEHRFLIAEQLRAVGIADAAHRAGAGRPQQRARDRRRRGPGRRGRPGRGAVDAGRRPRDRRYRGAARSFASAAVAARAGRVVTFGMRPTAPETGYGYIEIGAALDDAPGVFAVARFVEKPDAATAARLATDGSICGTPACSCSPRGRCSTRWRATRPTCCTRCAARWPNGTSDLDFIRLGVEAFTACPSISLDYAVAERTSHAAVVPADIGWSDVGSWGALWELGRKDADGNVAVGDVLLESARNCYVRSDGMLAAVVGLEDAVVVVTEDAVLAMHRDHAQDVKKVVDRLKAAGRHEAVAHNRCTAPGASTRA